MYKTNRYYLPAVLLTFVLFISVNGKAQDKSYWELNVNGGTSLFFGDIKQNQWWPISDNENEWRGGGGVQFGRQLSYVIGLRGQFLYGQLAGTRREWKRYFQSDYYETNINATINLINLFGVNKRSDRFVNVYFLGGIGLIQYNTTVYELNSNKVLAQVGNGHGKGFAGRTLEGIFTGGIGVDLRVNDHFHVNLEMANRAMNSDSYDHWENDFQYDVYNYTSIGLTWRFGVGKHKDFNYTIKETDFNYQEYEDQVSEPEPVEVEINLDSLQIPKNEPVQQTQEVQKAVTEDIVEPVETQDPEIITPIIEYRVQIRAKYGEPISIEYLSNKYHIPIEEINEDFYRGFYIYSVGSYNTYEEAKVRRNIIRRDNEIYDAFIVAFKNGVRMDKLP